MKSFIKLCSNESSHIRQRFKKRLFGHKSDESNSTTFIYLIQMQSFTKISPMLIKSNVTVNRDKEPKQSVESSQKKPIKV